MIRIASPYSRVAFAAAAAAIVITAWFFVRWNFANVISAKLDPARPESRSIAEWLTAMAPSDPQTHYALAVILEKTLDPADLSRSVSEYETAVSLSPTNYLMWMALGKARSQSGDLDGANAALERALELAPNNAAVQWAAGNSLVRNGKAEEGFGLIARAAAADAVYARNAAAMALQFYDGNAERARSLLGDNESVNAGLAAAFADAGRPEDAFDAWSRLKAESGPAARTALGEALAGKFSSSGKYALAAQVLAGIRKNESERPAVDQFTNGGFEGGVKLTKASLFEWQIAEGPSPQIGLSESQTHSGKYSLVLVFNSLESGAFRAVSQTVAVSPGKEYEVTLFYKSDLKSSAVLKWQVTDAASSGVLAASGPLAASAEWTAASVRFKAPAASDGIILRLVQEGCSGPVCAMSGRVIFDDFQLKRI